VCVPGFTKKDVTVAVEWNHSGPKGNIFLIYNFVRPYCPPPSSFGEKTGC